MARFSQPHAPSLAQDADSAVREFVQSHAAATHGYEWTLLRRRPDHTHVHYWFGLSHNGIRFPEVFLKVHFNRGGWVDFASSNWKRKVFTLKPEFGAAWLTTRWRESLRREGAEPRVRGENVYWVDSSGRPRPAVQMEISAPRRGVFRRFYADPVTGRVLAERKVLRGIDNNVYEVSPFNDGAANFEMVTLGGIAGGATNLSTDWFNVRREQLNSGTDQAELVDIDPATDFSADGDFSASPAAAQYDFECEGDATACPNQGFDGVNAYHHAQEFRTWVESLLGELGIAPADVFRLDPIDIIVNIFSIDLNGNGERDDVNNAFYLPLACTSEADAPEACIFFFRAENVIDPSCGEGAFQFYHLSRETIIITHEYQHYVTDMMAGLQQGQSGFNVGDALHEGYSDYFAVSFTTEDSGTDQTLVGASAFRECTNLQRQIGTPSVLELVSSDPAAQYTAGTTWATGLFELRKALGARAVDLLALKAMNFLPVDAGFVDSVEALVQADASLGGDNGTTIRELFYNTLAFTGGATIRFRDPARGVVEVGFQSCATAWGRGAGGATGLLFLLWSLATCLGGRWLTRR